MLMFIHTYLHTSKEVTLIKLVGLSRGEINEFNCSREITFRSFCLVAPFQYTLRLWKMCVCVCTCVKGNENYMTWDDEMGEGCGFNGKHIIIDLKSHLHSKLQMPPFVNALSVLSHFSSVVWDYKFPFPHLAFYFQNAFWLPKHATARVIMFVGQIFTLGDVSHQAGGTTYILLLPIHQNEFKRGGSFNFAIHYVLCRYQFMTFQFLSGSLWRKQIIIQNKEK